MIDLQEIIELSELVAEPEGTDEAAAETPVKEPPAETPHDNRVERALTMLDMFGD
jgi:hypothetical protein